MIGAYATINANKPKPEVNVPPTSYPTKEPETTPQTTQTKDLVKIYGPRLKNAIDLAGVAQAQAMREINENPLYQVYKDEALKLQFSNIDFLRSNRIFAVAQRYSISFGEITVDSNEKYARVRAIPVWEVIFFCVLNQQCVGKLLGI